MSHRLQGLLPDALFTLSSTETSGILRISFSVAGDPMIAMGNAINC